MTWLGRLIAAWRAWRVEIDEPLWIDYPDSAPASCDLKCPDTQPTSPGALDTLPGRLEL